MGCAAPLGREPQAAAESEARSGPVPGRLVEIVSQTDLVPALLAEADAPDASDRPRRPAQTALA